IGNFDRVGPEEISVLRRRALGDEARRYRDGDIPGDGTVHPGLRSCLRRGLKSAAFRRGAQLAPRGDERRCRAGFPRPQNTRKRRGRRAKEYGFMPPAVKTERDLRLDLFRGVALWLIFLDHLPSNVVSWITIRNYGFSDATEIFIFISGYTA